MRRIRAITLLAAVVLVAAPATAPAAPKSRVEYGVEVGLICAEAEDDYVRAGKGLSGGRGAGNFVPFFDRFLDVFERTIDQIALVPAAPGDEALVIDWVGKMRRSARLANRTLPVLKQSFRVLKAAEGEKTERYRTLNRRAGRRFKKADNALADAGDVAKELTAEGCAAPGAA